MTVISDIKFSISPSIGVTYHTACDMAGPKYLTFAINSPESNTCPYMVYFIEG